MIHLAIPGLLWPADSASEALRGLALPALATLLGRGRRDRGTAVTPERWLCETFAVRGEELPCGALRLLGDSGAPGGDAWLCADPVHLSIARDTLVIDAQPPDLDEAEATQLVAELNAQLGDYGEFVAPRPRRWYLRARTAPRILTHPPSAIAGRTLEPFLPAGADALPWRRLINETQVLLHNHPVNAAREAAGRPMANSLWPWGAGTLPAASAPAPRLFADAPLARGLALRAGIEAAPLPARFDAAAVPGLFLLDSLAAAAQSLDAGAWRAALAELEARWFAPALAAIKARRVASLRLTALGDEGVVDVALSAADAWRFWRRPLSLAALAA